MPSCELCGSDVGLDEMAVVHAIPYGQTRSNDDSERYVIHISCLGQLQEIMGVERVEQADEQSDEQTVGERATAD